MFSLKGKSLDEKSMVMLMNVMEYFRRRDNLSEIIVAERTAEACGVSVNMVYRTKARFKAAAKAGTRVQVPLKKGTRRKKLESDDSNDSQIHTKEDNKQDIEYIEVKQELEDYKHTNCEENPVSCFDVTTDFIKVEQPEVLVVKEENALH